MKKILEVISSLLPLIAGMAGGCGMAPDESRAVVETAAGPVDRAHRMALVDKKFSKEDVCDDWQLAMVLLETVQPREGAGWSSPDLLQGRNRECPGQFSKTAEKLDQIVRSLRDFHAQLGIGYGFDEKSPSIITSCKKPSGGSCEDLVGAALRPLRSDVWNSMYASIWSASGALSFYAIESIDEANTSELVGKLIRDFEVSPTAQGVATFQSVPYLLHRVIDSRNEGTRTFELREVETGARLEVISSFAPAQTVFAPVNAPEVDGYFINNPALGCVDYLSNDVDLGLNLACLTNQHRAVLRIASWFTNSNESLDTRLAGLLQKIPDDVARSPVVLDLRANTGGDTLGMLRFLCRIGDDAVRTAAASRVLKASYWPEYVALGSELNIATSSLPQSTNTDLFRPLAGWTAGASDKNDRRIFSVDYLKRHGLSTGQCQALQNERLGKMKFVILTNGREFSATEDFLDMVSESPGRFRIIGRQTMGGSGFPASLRLPKTGMTLRISQARLYDSRADQLLIEGKGVKPHKEAIAETVEGFESRLRSFLQNGGEKDSAASTRIPAIVETALSEVF